MSRSAVAIVVFGVLACSSTPAAPDGGGGAASSSSSGGGGGAATCPVIPITDGIPDACDATGPLARAAGGVTSCTADSSVAWPAKIFRVPVAAGDCLHMRADNAGSPAGADLFGAIVVPGGESNLFDEETPCSVENQEGYACPEGSATIDLAGDAYVVVGAWEGSGCPPGEETPFQLAVSRDGVDVDVSELCAADLLEIIP